MPKLRVHNFAVSIDGFAAGPRQSLEHPLGEGGMALHEWAFKTRSFRRSHGMGEDGETGIDDDFIERGFEDIGAWILGRNMFGPVRGPWLDDSWKGWWGDNPVYQRPVFILTHYARPPLVMEGGTTFHFVTEGIEAALEQAFDAAYGRDVRLGGGAETVRQYLNARLIDEMHIAIAPALLGSGERLFEGVDLTALGYGIDKRVATEGATHVVMSKRER